jgi:hypothetical protein
VLVFCFNCRSVESDEFIVFSESMKETLSLDCIHFDQEDPSGLNKAAALSLIKVVLYNNPSGEVAANVLATVLLYIPYNVDFNRQLHQVSSSNLLLIFQFVLLLLFQYVVNTF